MPEELKDDPSRFIRLENKSGDHNKFYEISLIVSSDPILSPLYKVIASWGAINRTPATISKYRGRNRWAAVTMVNDLVTSKTRKGYTVHTNLNGAAASEHEDPSIKANEEVKADQIIDQKLPRFKRFTGLDVD